MNIRWLLILELIRSIRKKRWEEALVALDALENDISEELEQTGGDL